jgi:thioredoxin 2
MSTVYRADLKGVISVCPACGQKNRLPYGRLATEGTCGKCQEALSLVNAPVDIPSAGVFNALIAESALPVLVDFWAAWCGPCKMVAPQLAIVAKQEAGLSLIVKVNTEELPGLSAQYDIQGIPALLLFKNGALVAQQAGAMPAAAIREFLYR